MIRLLDSFTRADANLGNSAPETAPNGVTWQTVNAFVVIRGNVLTTTDVTRQVWYWADLGSGNEVGRIKGTLKALPAARAADGVAQSTQLSGRMTMNSGKTAPALQYAIFVDTSGLVRLNKLAGTNPAAPLASQAGVAQGGGEVGELVIATSATANALDLAVLRNGFPVLTVTDTTPIPVGTCWGGNVGYSAMWVDVRVFDG